MKLKKLSLSISQLLFYQVYTINVPFKGKKLPMLYSLLPNKKEDTYKRLYNILTTPSNGLYLKKIDEVTLDFKKAIMNAIEISFPDVLLLLCYFHYCQIFNSQLCIFST